MKKGPFWKSYDRLRDRRIEFRCFKFLAAPEIKALAHSFSRFQPLEDAFSFFVSNDYPEDLQLWFGQRSMFRKDGDRVAKETGGALHYSIGPTGDVVVTIYPMQSSLARPFEDHIYLRIGSYSGIQLFEKLPSDINDLIAYCYVTSLDAEPAIREKLRIWWLRRTHPMQVKGEFVPPMTFHYGGKAFKFTLQTMFLALIKPLAIVTIIVLLTYFGMPELAALLRASGKP